MRIKFALVLCALTVFISSTQVNAASGSTEREDSERVWVDKSSPGVTRYFSLHRDDNRWWLDEYAARDGEFQRFVGKQSFDRSQDAVAEVRKRVPPSDSNASYSAFSMSPVTEVPGRVIWKVENTWDWNWELRYSEWFRENIKEDFFQKYQIGVDCADVAFSARWIFSRINHLPAASSLAATGALFTQDVMLKEWASLPQAEKWNEDPLFIAALKYVMDNTYTHTLMRDSYPIRIVKEAFLPGIHHMSLTADSGHTYLVSAVDLSKNSAEPIRVIYSTVPAEARRLSESGFWETRQPAEGQGGFVRFRWPEKSGENWLLKPAAEMPFYSTEQYTPSFMDGFQSFAEAVAVKLNPDLDFKARLESAINTMIERFRARATIVEKGEKVCATEDCSEGSKNYENWSTPLKDQNLGETLQSLENYAEQMSERVPGISQQWDKSLQKPAIRLQGVDYSLGALLFAWKTGSFSSDPRQPSDVRWGLSGSAFQNVIKKKLQQWLDERFHKIDSQGTSCLDPNVCKAGSPEWQSLQTFDLDAKIQALALGSASYCDYAPVPECDRYQSALELNSLTVGSRTETMDEWLDLFPWLNSSPRRSQEERWGLLNQKYHSYLTQAGDTLEISKTGWMIDFVSGNSTSPILRNAFTGKRIYPSEGYEYSVLDLESGLAIAEKAVEKGRQIQVINPDDQTVRLSQKLSLDTELDWILPSRLVLAGEHEVQIFDCSRSACEKEVSQPVARKPQLLNSNKQSISGLLLVQQSSGQDTGAYTVIDARAHPPSLTSFSWKDIEGYLPERLQFETRDYWAVLAFKKGAEGGLDPRQFFVRKSDGKVVAPPTFGDGEYLLQLSQNGHWGVLGQIYEPGGPLNLVELDENLKIGKRVALGNQVISSAPNCADSDSFYFLVRESRPDAQTRVQYYRLSDNGISKALLLSDEVEVKAGCRDEMVLITSSGERLRRWGDLMPRFESAKVEFLPPNPQEKEVRWVISAPVKGFQQSELYDLNSLNVGGPVLTGLLTLSEEDDDHHMSKARVGALISVGQDRSIWLAPLSEF